MDEEKRDSGEVFWGETADGLRLGLSAKGGIAGLYLQNVGNVPLDVMSHISTHELHLDWYTLQMKNTSGLNRKLCLLDARDRSVAIRIHLEPRESLQHFIDVGEWARRSVNGAKPLAPGSYQLFAVYDVANEKDCWLGHLNGGNGVRVEIT